MTAEPLKDKICGATEKGIFFEKKDVAAAVESFKFWYVANWLNGNLPSPREIEERLNYDFEDVMKKEAGK
jgi:hypothetical protein